MASNKLARKRSSDPAQEKLREHKSKWNESASTFIAQLIAFKRGINGRGESKVGLPPSNIKDPLPNEITQYLSEMVGRFSYLAEEASAIITEQENYSNSRQKSKKQASLDNIVKQASWAGSRIKFYAKSLLTFWNGLNRKKAKLLWQLADVESYLKDIQDLLVSNNENSAALAFYKFALINSYLENIHHGVQQVNEAYDNLKSISDKIEKPSNLSETQKEKLEEEPEKPLKNLQDKLQTLMEDKVYLRTIIDFISQNELIDKNIIDELFKKDQLLNKLLSTAINNNENDAEGIKLYNDILFSIKKALKDKFENIDESSSFKDLFSLIKKAYVSNELIKTAHNYLSRLLKRTKMKILSYNENRFRIDAFDLITNILNNSLDVLQDNLENPTGSKEQTNHDYKVLLDDIKQLGEMMLEVARVSNINYSANKVNDTKTKLHKINEGDIKKAKDIIKLCDSYVKTLE